MEKKIMITISQEWLNYAENLCLEDFGVVNLSVLFAKLLNKHKKEQMDSFEVDEPIKKASEVKFPQTIFGGVSIGTELGYKARIRTKEENERLLLEKYGTPEKPTPEALAAQGLNSNRANRTFKSIKESTDKSWQQIQAEQEAELAAIADADFSDLNLDVPE